MNSGLFLRPPELYPRIYIMLGGSCALCSRINLETDTGTERMQGVPASPVQFTTAVYSQLISLFILWVEHTSLLLSGRIF